MSTSADNRDLESLIQATVAEGPERFDNAYADALSQILETGSAEVGAATIDFREDGKVIDPNGFVWINGGENTDDHLAFAGHETMLIQIARSLLPAGGTFLDVGAHVGLYTLNLATKAKRVIAVEANPKTYAVLLENIKANANGHNAVVHATNIAAWDTFAMLDLKDANGKDTGGSTWCVEGGTTVSGMPLDAALPDVSVDLVKIDVEGAEARVLWGMQHRISLDRPILFIEMHDRVYGIDGLRDQVITFLDEHGYEWNDDLTHGGDGCYYIVARPVDVSEDFEIDVVRAGE